MRPVLRCCFLASYVLLPALGNASVPVSNGPFDSFYHNPLEPHSIPILNLKAVSHAPNRLDILRLRCIKLNLLTNLLDMHRYCCNIPNRFHIPDLIKQFFLCKYMVRILSKESQKVKLLGGKGFLLTVDINTAGGLINLDTTYFNYIILWL